MMGDSVGQIDMAYLQDMSGGDHDFIIEILSTFLETSASLLDAMEAAARSGDSQKAVYVTHTLKGSLRSIGADSLASLCNDLEHIARAGDMARFSELSDKVVDGFGFLSSEIEKVNLGKAA